MKNLQTFEQFNHSLGHFNNDFIGQQAAALGMSREEYVAHYATMTVGVDESLETNKLINILINSMEEYDEDTFMDLSKELTIDRVTLKEIFNDYWNVGAKDRTDWNDKEWSKWLKSYRLN